MIAWAALIGLSKTASGAVRVCSPQVAGFASAPTEIEAKREALKAWKSKAAASGANYANWRLSTDRKFTCKQSPALDFHCFAVARPCIIEHAPDTLEMRKNRQDI